MWSMLSVSSKCSFYSEPWLMSNARVKSVLNYAGCFPENTTVLVFGLNILGQCMFSHAKAMQFKACAAIASACSFTVFLLRDLTSDAYVKGVSNCSVQFSANTAIFESC